MKHIFIYFHADNKTVVRSGNRYFLGEVTDEFYGENIAEAETIQRE